jgi:hypothetical protein
LIRSKFVSQAAHFERYAEKNIMTKSNLWIFHSAGARFSGGVFSNQDSAEAWISKNNLTGILTSYPLDEGVYDWALTEGLFSPTKDKHKTPEFIGGFTSASQDHYHYENGKKDA